MSGRIALIVQYPHHPNYLVTNFIHQTNVIAAQKYPSRLGTLTGGGRSRSRPAALPGLSRERGGGGGLDPRKGSGNAPPRGGVCAGEGRPTRTGTGETSAGCVVEKLGTSDVVDVDAEVPRDGLMSDGVVGRLGVDADGGGYGERARRPTEAESMGDCDCPDGELLRCTSVAANGTGEGMGAVRGVRAGESVGGVGGAAAGVLRPERVDRSVTGPGGSVNADSGAFSMADAGMMRMGRTLGV